MRISKIKVGYVVSYDYDLLLLSIKQLYINVDKIYLAIDKERKTWSGNLFEIKDSFFAKINKLDVNNKIEYYYDSFYVASLSPSECETRERNMLLKKMGRGWLIQLDTDEYIYDFDKLSSYLNKYWYLTVFPKYTPIVFRGKLITLFKKIPEGYLYIDNDEKFSFITNIPNYEACRANKSIRNYFINCTVIHNSWGRSEDELLIKIKNWGHRDDFDTQKFFEFWEKLNYLNYSSYKNFHPIVPEVWNQLFFTKSKSVKDFISIYAQNNEQKLIGIKVTIVFKALFNKLNFFRKRKNK